MIPLKSVTLTPEQLKLVRNPRPGVSVIRGAAGSGKTTTALHRLKFLATFRWNQRKREAAPGTKPAPVRVLVLTYNKTLKGYVEALAREHLPEEVATDLTISTFDKWAYDMFPQLVNYKTARAKIWEFGWKLAGEVGYEKEFLLGEVEYVLGRYLPGDRKSYLTAKREGRGAPRVEQAIRSRIIKEVINPYLAWLGGTQLLDGHTLACAALGAPSLDYDVIVVDEAQDFSANQVRAIMHHAAPQHAVTFVLDAAQRIYPRFFTWAEAGITIAPNESHRLERNYRNTLQIAALAKSLLVGLDVGDDGTLPDLSACDAKGRKPVALVGLFNQQTTAAIDYIGKNVDLATESVAFLHPLGGGWFDYLRDALNAEGLPFVEIAGKGEWPDGTENIALSTFHSVKGLEFDHVIALGLGPDTLPHGKDADDEQYTKLRRLLAMGIGRARKSVVLGYKPGEAASFVNLFDPATIDTVKL